MKDNIYKREELCLMRRFLLFFLTFVLLISALPIQGSAESYRYEDDFPQPIISVSDMDMPSINPGRSRTLSLTLQAMGNHATDVVVNPQFTEPLSSSSFSSSISVGNINQGSKKSLDLSVSVAENAAPGNYPIVLNFTYYYDNGESRVPATGSATIYVKVSGKGATTRLTISNISTKPEIILPDQDIRLNILFENQGSLDANNVNIRLEGLDINSGFYIASGTDVKYLDRVPSNMISSIFFDLRTGTNIEKGPHELTLSFQYGEVEEKQKIYLVVGDSETYSSNLIMENLEYPTANIGENSNFIINFDLRNNGESDTKNVLIRAESNDSTIVPKSISVIKLDNIMAGESESLSFTFSPTEDAVTRNYPINIDIEYDDNFNEDKKHTINQYLGMNVVIYEDDETKEKPKLIIDRYSLEPQTVRPGEDFQIDLSIYNTNSTEIAKNIKVFLEAKPEVTAVPGASSASILTSVDNTNTFYIDSIPPKGRVEKTINMSVESDAEAKTHTVSANFEYEDDDGNQLNDMELISVPVVQESKLETGEISHKTKTYVGRSTDLSLEFYNTGRVTLYNVLVKLEGDFEKEDGELFVGNLESGSSELFEAKVIPNEVGQLEGAVVLSYEDFAGETQEIRRDFSMEVESSLGFLSSTPFWITVGILVATIVSILVHRKVRMKKELAADD